MSNVRRIFFIQMALSQLRREGRLPQSEFRERTEEEIKPLPKIVMDLADRLSKENDGLLDTTPARVKQLDTKP